METSLQVGEVVANEWELRHDETSGQAYYVNLRTGESSWEAPGVSALPADGSASVHRQWTEVQDETGRVYFINLETMETSWDPPPGYSSTVSARARNDTLTKRPSTAEQMDQLNALLSGGDGDEGEDEETEEQAPSTADSSVIPTEDVAAIPQVSDGSEWMMFLNETDGIPYYYNHITGECVWEPPAAFLEYHLQHSETNQDNGSLYVEQGTPGEPTELRVIATPAPHPPMSPPPASPKAQTPVPITPEFEEKVRRAIETVSKTPVGSSRLLFVRTPTVKSIEGVSTSRSVSRPSSSSGRTASRPGSSTGSARQRVATARALIDSEQAPVATEASEFASEAVASDTIEPAVPEGDSPGIVAVDEVPVTLQEGREIDSNEELDPELQQHDEMMQELLFDETALVIQCLTRCFVARRRVARKRKEREMAGELLSDDVVQEPEHDHGSVQGVGDQETPEHDQETPEQDLQTPEHDHGDEAHSVEHPVFLPELGVIAQEDMPSLENSVLPEDTEVTTMESEFVAQEAVSHNIDASEAMTESPLEIQPTPMDAESAVVLKEQAEISTGDFEPKVAEVLDGPSSEIQPTPIDVEADAQLEEGEVFACDEPEVTAVADTDTAMPEAVMALPITEIQSTPNDHEFTVVSEEQSEIVMEADQPDATTNTATDYVAQQPEQDAEIVGDLQITTDVGNCEPPPQSEPKVFEGESVLFPTLKSTDAPERNDAEVAATEATESLETHEADQIRLLTESVSVSEEVQGETSVTLSEEEREQQEVLSARDPIATLPSFASENLAQVETPVETKPESTRRSARQAAKSGRCAEGGQVGAAPASPVCEVPKSAAVDFSKNRLAVLNVASFFPVAAPRQPRAPEMQGTKVAAQRSSPANGSIVRKAVPSPSAVLPKPSKTEEQRQQERLSLAKSKEKARQEATAKWKLEVAQYQQIYADSATRSIAERQRMLDEETLRLQAAALEKQERTRKAAEVESDSISQEPTSVWEAVEGWNKVGSVEQIKSIIKTGSELEGFVTMMMDERVRAVKATAERLRLNNNKDRAVFWQERVVSFPSSADQISSCKDVYWARLYSKLHTLASSSSTQELTQQLSKHRTDSLDSLLHLAAWQGNAAVVESLVSELGFDANALDNSVSKVTPLHEASRGGHVDVVECLLAHGAFLDAIDAHGETPLHAASRLGHSQVVHRLIAAGEAHQDREDSEPGSHSSQLRSLSWAQCVHWRNNKHRRAVDIATLPSLKESLTQYSSECQSEADAAHKSHEPHSRGASATSTAAKTSKIVLKKKKLKSARPKSATRSLSNMSLDTAAAALAVHAR